MTRAAVIGDNSAGKSTLYNKTFNLELEVGVDDTTQQVSKVYDCSQRSVEYFDSPGVNETTNVASPEVLKVLYSLKCVFIATSVTFKKLKRLIRIMDRINPPMLYLLRTQCDKFPSEEEFESAKAKDLGLLKEWGIKREVLYVSSMEGEEFKDNARFRKLFKELKE